MSAHTIPRYRSKKHKAYPSAISWLSLACSRVFLCPSLRFSWSEFADVATTDQQPTVHFHRLPTTHTKTPHHTRYYTVNCGLNARIQGHQQPTSQQAMPTSKGIRITKNAQCSMLIHSFSQRTPHNQQPPRRWMTSSRLPTEQTSPPKAKSQNIATLQCHCRFFASLSFIVVVVVTSVRPFIRLPHHHPYTSRYPVADLKRRGDRQSGVLLRLWRGMRRFEDSQPVVIRQCDDVGVPQRYRC